MNFETINPANGERLGSYAVSTSVEVEQAIATLHFSFTQWRDLAYADRQNFLKKLADNLTAQQEMFATLMTNEMGKPIKESRAEVKKCIQAIKSYCERDLSLLEKKSVHTIYKQSDISHEPLGVIYAIMPWNFPLWQVVRMVVPALLSGNVVLLKHSQITVQTGNEFEKLFRDVWSQPLLFHRMIAHEQTEKVMQDPRVQGISLTGSTRAGISAASAAALSLKKYVLELGGSDAYIVLEDAPLAAAAKALAKGRLLNTGQSCICVKRCLVHSSKQNELIELLKKEFESFKFGNPLDDKTDLGSLAHPKFKEALKKQLLELTENTSAKNVYRKAHGQSEKSAFVDAEIYLLKENSPWLAEQEFFAPILLVIPFQTDEQAIEIANSSIFGLGGGVWSADLARAQKVASAMIAGQVAINDVIKSDVSLPFGGFKKSGVGREMGDAGLFEFTQTKVISSSL
ncbi:MAG: aldehyde dehydrogenase family protein [Bdellovibrio sp.]|nr:aldehyde dehydrogenase family protein [Bdellovibrio sp.]